MTCASVTLPIHVSEYQGYLREFNFCLLAFLTITNVGSTMV